MSTPYQIHSARQTRAMLMAVCAFAFSSCVSAIGMFNKRIESGVASPEGMILVAMMAVVAATMLGTSTMMFMGLAAGAARRQRWAVVGLGVSLLPFVVGISTGYAVLGTAGAPSLTYDLRDSAAAHARYFDAGLMDASAARSAAIALAPLESSICALADKEGKTGVLSGAPGKGSVHAAFTSACESVQSIIATLNDTAARDVERREVGARILAILTALPDDAALPIFERQAMFRREAGALRKIVEDSRTENVGERLRAQLRIAQASVATLGVKDTAFGRKQAADIQGLRDSLGLVAETVDGLLAVGGVGTVAPPPPLKHMTAAVLAHWHRNIPEILIAILSDALLVWTTALLVVSRDAAEHEDRRLKARRRRGGV